MVDCDRFPGIEFKDIDYFIYGSGKSHRHNIIFSTYQCESKVIECMKDTLTHMGKSRLVSVEIRHGESWWDRSKFYNKEDVVGRLFEDSLGQYITRFSMTKLSDNRFEIQIKVHELDNIQRKTNIGPDLIEYMGSLFGRKL